MVRVRLSITGIVQGVGFRPFAWRRATRLGLTGFVENTPSGVVIELEGSAVAVAAFTDALAEAAPPLAMIERVVVEVMPPPADQLTRSFQILESTAGGGPRSLVPPDIATCNACLSEMRNPADRRHGHPFINCTDCGPRFTIIRGLPYDRAATTMQSFGMCSQCLAEYQDPANRRFHAQPIACPNCGPVVWFATTPREGCPSLPTERPEKPPRSSEAIAEARRLLQGGGILAMKNIGGFHLVCDATNPAAVGRLRDRKRRPAKPLAVMAADLTAAQRIGLLDDQAVRLLVGPERPIVVVPKRPAGGGLAAAVSPENDFLGLMLPVAPLQHLLGEGLPPLVMTSGNLAEEPLAIDNAEAVQRLSGIADGFLFHDRGIHIPADDSVVRCVAGAPLPIRRSRGHTPLPIRLASDGPAVLAAGGELKAALCLAVGDRAIMSQHIGDVGNSATLAALEHAAKQMLELYAVEPVAIAADLHPGSLSANWAKGFAQARGIPLVRVQHHEAHVAALLAEHSGAAHPPPALDTCLVACFDGTGYAPSEAGSGLGVTIQGGEFFLADCGGIRRVAHLAPFLLPGGDAAIRHPWRTALAVLHAAGIDWHTQLPAVQAAGKAAMPLLRQQLQRGLACTPTTSMGRLFDAVAAIVGGPQSISFEAEAAIALESWATEEDPADDHRYAFDISPAASGQMLVIGWRDLITRIVRDVLTGEARERIAVGFHHAVIRMIDDVRQSLTKVPIGGVGCTGGVFQNATLLQLTAARLRASGYEVLLHHALPPNDGGLALGQAVLAREAVSHGGKASEALMSRRS